MPLPWLIGGAVLGGIALAAALSDDDEDKSQKQPDDDKDEKIYQLEYKRDELYLQVDKMTKSVDEEMKFLAQSISYFLEPFGVDESSLHWDNRYASIKPPDFDIEKYHLDLDEFSNLALTHALELSDLVVSSMGATQDYLEIFFNFNQELNHGDFNRLWQLDREINEMFKLLVEIETKLFGEQ